MEKIDTPKSPHFGIAEQFFIEHGLTIGLWLFCALAFALLYLLTLYFYRYRIGKSKNTDLAKGKQSTNDQATVKTKFLQTPEGMSIALLSGTIVTCIVGFSLVALYKWVGFDDDFGQGSGSLIQAVWGSAATITAAIVAIMLALEAIKTAETTNKLQLEANQLSEYESPAYATLTEIGNFKRRLDQYALSIYTTVGISNGLIIKGNMDDYEESLIEFFSLCKDIYSSESFLLLDGIPLSSLKDVRAEDAIIRTLPDIFTIDPFTKEVRPPNCSDLVFMLKRFCDHTSAEIKSLKTVESRIKLLNSTGRAHWGYMYTLKIALNQIKYIDIVNYTNDKMGLSFSKLSSSQKQKFDKESDGIPSRADNILHQLALAIVSKNNRGNDDDPSATEKAYKFFKENLAQIGSQYLEKLKYIAEDEAAPKSLRAAANKIIQENS